MARTSLLVTLAATALVAGAATWAFDANRLKPWIGETVRAATGRELRIDGDLSVHFFPSARVNLGAARLFNKGAFDAAALAEIESAEIGFALLPLLRRQVHITDLSIDGLRLKLRRKADGQDNWSDLMPAHKTGGANGRFVAVDRLRIKRAQLAIDDEAGQRQWFLHRLALSAGGWGRPDTSPFELSAIVASQWPPLYGPLTLTGETQVDLPLGLYTARKLALTYNGTGIGEPLAAKMNGKLAFDRPAGTLSVKATAKLLDLDLKAEVVMRGISDELRFDGRLAVARFNPRELLQRLGRAVPRMRDATALTSADVAMRVHGDATRLIVAPIDANLDASELAGYITVADYKKPRVDFRLTVNRIDLDRYRSPDSRLLALDDALSILSKNGLRELGYAVTGEVNVGVMTLARARGDDYRKVVTAEPRV
ncbi:MAG: AsmA family protein [Panacagrimonas sp.]